MTADEIKAKLAALTFKSTPVTVGEAVLVQQLKETSDLTKALLLIVSRVEGNEDGSKLKPSDMWDMTLPDLTAFVEARVAPGISAGLKGAKAMGKALGVH